MIQKRGVDSQAQPFCLLHNPVERFVRKPVRRLAATYIAMHAGEPCLFYLTCPIGRTLP